ncbi:MAG TPA: hypothetical protein VIM60_00010 [Edaphobacter sp.]
MIAAGPRGGAVHADPDPIKELMDTRGRFDRAWITDGSKLTWPQRITIAAFSLFILAFGLTQVLLGIKSISDAELFSMDAAGGICWIILGLVFSVPAVLALRNTLHFPIH